MLPRIVINSHLSEEQLYRRYRACRHAQEKVRWRALYLIAKGDQANAAARKVGRSSGWITLLARRYNEHGPSAVPNRKGALPSGRKPYLTPESFRLLSFALLHSAPDGGTWTAPKVALWVKEHIGITVNQATAWRWMRTINSAKSLGPKDGKAHQDRAKRRLGASPVHLSAAALRQQNIS